MTGENELKTSHYYDYEDKLDPWGKGVPFDGQKPAQGFGG